MICRNLGQTSPLNFKSAKMLAICLTVLLVAGCERCMTTEEVVAEIKECEDAGMEPVQFFNGFTQSTNKIVCKIKKEM